jgi:hypothetical protein
VDDQHGNAVGGLIPGGAKVYNESIGESPTTQVRRRGSGCGRTREPAVAVIVPAFNAARTIAETLESLSAQTLRDFEAVVVDDGSTDETLAIATAFMRRDSRIRVITQPNRGVAAARNAAMGATGASLIAALDADDLWHPTFLGKLAAALWQAGSATTLAYAGSRVIDMQGRVLRNAPVHDREGWVFNQMVLQNLVGNGSAMMFRREFAERLGGYDGRLQHVHGAQGCEDWLLALGLASMGPIAAVQEYLVGYRSVPGGMSENTLRLRRSRVHALEYVQGAVRCSQWKSIRWALGTAHAKCFLHEVRWHQPGPALASLGKGLRLDPLGTLALLFGPSRLRWLWENYVSPPVETPLRPFLEVDPKEGFVPSRFLRDTRAERWDAALTGPIDRVQSESPREWSLKSEPKAE